MTEINQLQKLKNCAASIVTGNSLEFPGMPLTKRLSRKTMDELITSESNIMVFKSLYELVPKYMCNLFPRTS